SLQADFSSTVAHNTTGGGYEFRAVNDGDLDVGLTNSASQGSKSDALHFTVDNATATIDVDGFTALNNGDNGVELNMINGAEVSVNSFNNVSINAAQRSGLKVSTLANSTLLAFNATNVTSNNNGLIAVANDGSGVMLSTVAPMSMSTFNFTNVTANNNRVRGVHLAAVDGTSNTTFNTLTATGNL